MNANAKLWLAELRSGKHKRATSKLRRTDEKGTPSYCCLGLACELYRQSTGRGKWSEDNLFREGRAKDECGLPSKVRKWLGLQGFVSDGLVQLPDGHRFANLAHANDAKGSSFKRVASIIEKEQAFLFKKD